VPAYCGATARDLAGSRRPIRPLHAPASRTLQIMGVADGTFACKLQKRMAAAQLLPAADEPPCRARR
jgi:hypothetical protein